jgi:hypothetical protein
MNTHNIREKINQLLSRYNIDSSQLTIVSSVQEWENIHGITDNNSFRLAVAARRKNSNVWDIIIKANIEEENCEGVFGAMLYRGFSELDHLKDMGIEAFILHLILHEIAHTKEIKAEIDADKWAYEELVKFNSSVSKNK